MRIICMGLSLLTLPILLLMPIGFLLGWLDHATLQLALLCSTIIWLATAGWWFRVE